MLPYFAILMKHTFRPVTKTNRATLIAIVNIVSFNANVRDFMNIELTRSSHHRTTHTVYLSLPDLRLGAAISCPGPTPTRCCAAASAALGCFYEEIKQKSTPDQTDNVVYRQIGAALTISHFPFSGLDAPAFLGPTDDGRR